jgi:hypothetical protein
LKEAKTSRREVDIQNEELVMRTQKTQLDDSNVCAEMSAGDGGGYNGGGNGCRQDLLMQEMYDFGQDYDDEEEEDEDEGDFEEENLRVRGKEKTTKMFLENAFMGGLAVMDGGGGGDIDESDAAAASGSITAATEAAEVDFGEGIGGLEKETGVFEQLTCV